MSSVSPPPSEQPQPARLTAAEELVLMLRQVTPTSEDEDDEGLGGGGQQFSSSPARTSTANSYFNEVEGSSPSSGPIRSHEHRVARRFADRSKLLPYQKDGLDELVKSSPLGQNAILFIQQCVLENKLDGIILAAPLYKVTPALKANIESVVVAVLLSSKLSAYKGSVPKDRVLSFMLRDRLHIPSTFDTDTYVSDLIETSISDSLTQARSRIKKTIREAIKAKTKNFDLATKLVKDTKCTVTVPLCGKIAILRTVHVEDSSADFWDRVDQRLEMIRSLSKGDPALIARAIKGYLKKDTDTYGSGPHDKVAPEQLNAWQQGVDDSLTVSTPVT
ncbi:hypothetical protein CVT25_001629 [Psilocybe cyanescens]|uniref:Uncharacterized protein n=1 Tax=Psilocybe cyanescens TaxID=93625 RepID=A0A409WQ89_PSICY|nr:hypothetical protein CVT25_001629 [Psilocybe cyanescens]